MVQKERFVSTSFTFFERLKKPASEKVVGWLIRSVLVRELERNRALIFFAGARTRKTPIAEKNPNFPIYIQGW